MSINDQINYKYLDVCLNKYRYKHCHQSYICSKNMYGEPKCYLVHVPPDFISTFPTESECMLSCSSKPIDTFSYTCIKNKKGKNKCIIVNIPADGIITFNTSTECLKSCKQELNIFSYKCILDKEGKQKCIIVNELPNYKTTFPTRLECIKNCMITIQSYECKNKECNLVQMPPNGINRYRTKEQCMNKCNETLFSYECINNKCKLVNLPFDNIKRFKTKLECKKKCNLPLDYVVYQCENSKCLQTLSTAPADNKTTFSTIDDCIKQCCTGPLPIEFLTYICNNGTCMEHYSNHEADGITTFQTLDDCILNCSTGTFPVTFKTYQCINGKCTEIISNVPPDHDQGIFDTIEHCNLFCNTYYQLLHNECTETNEAPTTYNHIYETPELCILNKQQFDSIQHKTKSKKQNIEYYKQSDQTKFCKIQSDEKHPIVVPDLTLIKCNTNLNFNNFSKIYNGIL